MAVEMWNGSFHMRRRRSDVDEFYDGGLEKKEMACMTSCMEKVIDIGFPSESMGKSECTISLSLLSLENVVSILKCNSTFLPRCKIDASSRKNPFRDLSSLHEQLFTASSPMQCETTWTVGFGGPNRNGVAKDGSQLDET